MAEDCGNRQRNLFEILEESPSVEPHTAIEGLRYVPDFVTVEQHGALLREIDGNAWMTDLKRRVQHYGYRYDYRSRSVDYSMRIGELPPWAAEIGRRLLAEEHFTELPDQLIVNDYEPGQGISNHIDCEPCFTGIIASLSLGSSCVMNFTNKESGDVIPVFLEPRSLVVLEGGARYGWMHGIPARKSDDVVGRTVRRSRRVSLTFRKVILSESVSLP
jgi:alkylated DNA repair dioxygenase AlkB